MAAHGFSQRRACRLIDVDPKTVRRAPVNPLIIGPHTLSELTGPVYGHEAVREADSSMSSALTPLADSAARITRCWLGPFGAVSPWLRPSWFTAEPRTSARILSPSRSASD